MICMSTGLIRQQLSIPDLDAKNDDNSPTQLKMRKRAQTQLKPIRDNNSSSISSSAVAEKAAQLGLFS